jgi:hypothetical protein
MSLLQVVLPAESSQALSTSGPVALVVVEVEVLAASLGGKKTVRVRSVRAVRRVCQGDCWVLSVVWGALSG